MAPLDAAQLETLSDSFERNPTGYTPTHDAILLGIELLAGATLPDAYEGSPRYLVLITNGVPTMSEGCELVEGDGGGGRAEPITEGQYADLIADVTSALGEGYGTFVVGSPGSEDPQGASYDTREKLSEVAVAGGTAPDGCSVTGPDYCHFDMTTEPDFVAGLTAVVGEIASSVISCTYPVPEPPEGEVLRPDLVEVVYFQGDVTEVGLPQQTAGTPCTGDGWQYSTDGQQILLCSQTCAAVQAESNARLTIVFPCDSLVG